jgi:nucleoside-diphosphate-sugar epimerase
MRPAPGSVIALTGATGFLGSHIADLLLAGGYRVRASVRATSNRRWIEGKDLDLREVDLTDAAACGEFLFGTAGLVHCAGVVSAPDEAAYRQANVTTTAALLEAARENWKAGEGVYLLISSLAAHGPAGLEAPARETDADRPITAYGRSKKAAEELVTGGGWPFRTAILRPPSLYGPRDTEFIPLFQAASRGITARIGTRMGGLSMVHGRDAARAALRLLETPGCAGTYFVDDGKAGYDWEEMARHLGTVLQRKVWRLTIPLGLLKIASKLATREKAASSPILNPDRLRDLDTPGWVCDGSKLVAEAGFAAEFDLNLGFTDTIVHLKDHGLL